MTYLSLAYLLGCGSRVWVCALLSRQLSQSRETGTSAGRARVHSPVATHTVIQSVIYGSRSRATSRVGYSLYGAQADGVI